MRRVGVVAAVLLTGVCLSLVLCWTSALWVDARTTVPQDRWRPSEREFADLLDYYRIPYLYEPRSFPLRWECNRVVEMHTPDFYLPEYDQYFELTTMKQNLVTQKNRKLRHVQELYPEINIQLLYRRDLMRLMGKYGFGPLAEVTDRGTERVLFSEEQIQARVKELGAQITEEYAGTEPVLIGVLRGVVDEVGLDVSDLEERISTPQTKHGLRALTEDAIARGVFGVPTFLHGEEMFWGHDRLDQLAASLTGDPSPVAARADAFLRRPRGAVRRRAPHRKP